MVSEATIKADIGEYIRSLTAERNALESKLADLHKVLASLDGKVSTTKGIKVAKASKASGKRKRRTPEEIKAEAEQIVAAIKAKGSEGAAASDLEQFDYGVSLKNFMKKYGYSIKSSGSTSKMRYFVK